MNPKDEQTNSEVSNLDDESSIKKKKNASYINENTGNDQVDKKSKNIDYEYKFGWNSYSEITNGRFAMIGFLAIILVELFSQQSFLKWAGIL